MVPLDINQWFVIGRANPHLTFRPCSFGALGSDGALGVAALGGELFDGLVLDHGLYTAF